MFGQLKKKEWRNSPAHLLLLSKFRWGDSPARYNDVDYWDKALGDKTSNVIKQFVKEGMLEPGGLTEKIGCKYNASDMKSILKENGLKVSGRKKELIQRLIDNDAEAMSEATKDIFIYRCSAVCLPIVENYVETEKAKEEAVKQEVFNLLIKGKLSKAVHVFYQYQAKSVFSSDDFVINDETLYIEFLMTIFNSTPAILKHIEENRLKQLRLAAGMMELWGTNTSRHWLPDGFDTGIHLDEDATCRMLIFHACYIRDMKNYREVGFRSIKILGTADDVSCSECRKISGKKYLLENVPELPYEKCTCEIGCRCTTIVDDDELQRRIRSFGIKT